MAGRPFSCRLQLISISSSRLIQGLARYGRPAGRPGGRELWVFPYDKRGCARELCWAFCDNHVLTTGVCLCREVRSCCIAHTRWCVLGSIAVHAHAAKGHCDCAVWVVLTPGNRGRVTGEMPGKDATARLKAARSDSHSHSHSHSCSSLGNRLVSRLRHLAQGAA